MPLGAERAGGVEGDVSAEAHARLPGVHRLASDDQPVADAGPDGDDREPGATSARAEPPLRLDEGDDVVLDRHSEPGR